MKNLKWKYHSKVNTHYGTIKGDSEPMISIQGNLCVVDIRPCRKEIWEKPKNYKITGLTLDEAKQLAEDLISGDNFELHEANRLAWIKEDEKTAKIIKDAEEFLEKLDKT